VSRLRDIVRQVKPVQETYRVDHADKIQNLLIEAKMAAADWEKVICVAYNIKGGMTVEEAKSEGEVLNWKDKYDPLLETGHKIVENSFTTTGGVMKHYGQGSGKLTTKWDDYFIKMTGKSATAPTKTPKTDMRLGSQNISLKKYGGSQLMSGGASETLATLGFAYDNAPNEIKSKEFDNAWNELITNIEEQYVAFQLPPGGQIGKISKQKGTSKLKKLVIDSMTKNTAMTVAIRNIMKTSEIKKEIVREAMSGKSKFADSKAAATHMMKFDTDGNSSFVVINDALVNSYTSATKFNISFKTSGTGGRAWTALKGIYKEPRKEETEILDDIISESIVETEQEFLDEGMFSSLLQKGKKITSGLIKKVRVWIKKFLSKVWQKIKAVMMKGLDLAMNLLNKKITVSGEGYSFKGW